MMVGLLFVMTLTPLVWSIIKGSMETLVSRHSLLPLFFISAIIYGCGSLFDDSYEEELANDRKILQEIINANPVLDSAANHGHYFFTTSSETGRITGELNLIALNLNDSNFSFPKGIRNFKRINSLYIALNDFSDLPKGTRNKSWEKIVVMQNKICNPSSETVAYLDEVSKGSPGGYWRDTQRCSDSIPVASP
jgi:hypothetical protein